VTRTPELSSNTFNIADEFVSRPAREHPDKLAILGVEREATYAELETEVNRVARALRDSGCKPGNRVLIALPDSFEFIAAFFGAAKIGAVAVPVNSMARTADYRHYLSNSGARFAMVHASILAEFASGIVAGGLELVVVFGRTVLRLQNTACKIVHYSHWLPAGGGAEETYPTSATDAAFFLYTSGSGGTPKAAVHRHRDMLVTARNYAQGVLGLHADDRMFSVSKLYFAYGLGNGMYFPLFFGASTVLYAERPRPDRVAQLVAQHRPTVFFAVPTFYAALLREAEQGMPFLPASRCPLRFSNDFANASASRFWTASAQPKCCTFFFLRALAKRALELAAARFPDTKRVSLTKRANLSLTAKSEICG
jgi:acyl-coenzyme A synthetase/AMP-(fatty) acid ligase